MSFAASRSIRSLGFRITVWYFIVFVASTLLLAAVADWRIRSSIQRRTAALLTIEVAAHREAFEAEGVNGLRKLTKSKQLEAIFVRVVDSGDVALFEYQSQPDVAFGSEALSLRSPDVRSVHERATGLTWSLTSAPLSGGRWLQVAIYDRPTQEALGHVRTGLVVVWIGAIALGLIGGLLITRRALEPLGRFAQVARRVIDSGDLSLRVPEHGGRDELDEVGHLFNGVLARNEKLVAGMRQALDNVAHDLRTPLTRLRTSAELALTKSGEPDKLREALADSIEESERVLTMLTTLMDISEAETGVMRLTTIRLDLSALVREVADLYAHVADERSVRIVTHLENAAYVNGDRNRLHRIVANLVDNAIKYSQHHPIELTTAHDADWVILSVSDHGVGIDAADLPRVWERLFRGDRSRGERGLGLGLSFVRALVEAHHGTVEATSTIGQGSTFTVRLPRAT